MGKNTHIYISKKNCGNYFKKPRRYLFIHNNYHWRLKIKIFSNIVFEAPFCHSMYNVVAKNSNSCINHITIALTSWMRNSTLALTEFLWFQGNLE